MPIIGLGFLYWVGSGTNRSSGCAVTDMDRAFLMVSCKRGRAASVRQARHSKTTTGTSVGLIASMTLTARWLFAAGAVAHGHADQAVSAEVAHAAAAARRTRTTALAKEVTAQRFSRESSSMMPLASWSSRH